MEGLFIGQNYNFLCFTPQDWNTNLIIQSDFFHEVLTQQDLVDQGINIYHFQIWSSLRCWCSQLILKLISRSAVFSSLSYRGLHLFPINKCTLQLSVWSSQSLKGQVFFLFILFSFSATGSRCKKRSCNSVIRCVLFSYLLGTFERENRGTAVTSRSLLKK